MEKYLLFNQLHTGNERRTKCTNNNNFIFI